MNDHSVFSLSLSRVVLFSLPVFQDSRYPRTQIPCLCPSCVGQGRIVGSRRSEVPLLVGLINSSTMSGDDHDCWLFSHVR